jgi:cold shock CspA family protein
MKNFGTVTAFDDVNGQGLITPETGGKDLSFERSAMSWDRNLAPATGQRLSYDLMTREGKTSAVNLHKI